MPSCAVWAKNRKPTQSLSDEACALDAPEAAQHTDMNSLKPCVQGRRQPTHARKETMPRLIKGASYSRSSHDEHLVREARTPDDSYSPQHGDDVQNHDESWEEAGQSSRKLDPNGTESLRLLHELQADL